MEFEHLLIQINEIFHKSIMRYKEEVLGKSTFSDVTISQLYYLEAVFHLGNPTLSELAEHLKVSKASATAGVQKLIKNGLAQKVRSSEDHRVFHVHPSADGLKLLEAEVHALTDFTEKIKRALSDKELQSLKTIFKKIIANQSG